MRDSDSNKFVAALAIIATPFALGAFMLAWSPAVQYGLEDPKRDGYVQPRSVYDLVDKTSESTVTVWCEVSKNNEAQGTAWAIELETAVSDIYPTTLITNHHVIEDCIPAGGKLTVAELFKKEVPAEIVKWDKKNDLAVLATGLKLSTPLEAVGMLMLYTAVTAAFEPLVILPRTHSVVGWAAELRVCRALVSALQLSIPLLLSTTYHCRMLPGPEYNAWAVMVTAGGIAGCWR